MIAPERNSNTTREVFDMNPAEHLLSFVTNDGGTMVTIHADLVGVTYLIRELEGIRDKLKANDCPHTHLLSNAAAGGALSTTKLADQSNESTIVHHVKIYGWNAEWAARHGLAVNVDGCRES